VHGNRGAGLRLSVSNLEGRERGLGTWVPARGARAKDKQNPCSALQRTSDPEPRGANPADANTHVAVEQSVAVDRRWFPAG